MRSPMMPRGDTFSVERFAIFGQLWRRKELTISYQMQTPHLLLPATGPTTASTS
jgi:hypothetical protein